MVADHIWTLTVAITDGGRQSQDLAPWDKVLHREAGSWLWWGWSTLVISRAVERPSGGDLYNQRREAVSGDTGMGQEGL